MRTIEQLVTIAVPYCKAWVDTMVKTEFAGTSSDSPELYTDAFDMFYETQLTKEEKVDYQLLTSFLYRLEDELGLNDNIDLDKIISKHKVDVDEGEIVEGPKVNVMPETERNSRVDVLMDKFNSGEIDEEKLRQRINSLSNDRSGWFRR